MARTKKPRKQYRPRQAAIPQLLQVQMTRDAHPDLALRLYMGIVNLVEAPTIVACNKLSYELCCIAGGMSHANNGQPILGRTDAASIAIRSAISTIESIVNRHDRTGVVKVTEFDAQSLHAAAGKLGEALARIPLPAYTRAVHEVKGFIGEVNT